MNLVEWIDSTEVITNLVPNIKEIRDPNGYVDSKFFDQHLLPKKHLKIHYFNKYLN